MIEACSAVERIAHREEQELARIEWALGYKKDLRDRCEAQGERGLANELAAEILDLQSRLLFHRLALALARGAAR